jgi:DNA-binding CsgD family transcriptional regulator/PAS domain-containing protein
MTQPVNPDEQLLIWGGTPGSEEIFSSIISNIINVFPQFIVIIDEEHTILHANTAILNALNMNLDEISGAFCPKAIHNINGPFSGCPLEESLREDKIVEKELLDPFYHNWVMSSIFPMNYVTPDGKRVFFHVAQDITEKKLAQETIFDQKQFLEHVLESLTQPFYVINVDDYTVKLANKAAGFEKLDKKATCYRLTHASNRPCNSKDHPCPLEIIKETRKPVVVEHIHSTGDGTEQYFEVHGYPIINDDGDVTQIIEYTFNISERKKAEKELTQAREDLELKSKNLEERNIALKVLLDHQEDEKKAVYKTIFTNMKTLVIPYVEKLKKTSLSEDQGKLIEILESSISEVVNPISAYFMDESWHLSPSETRVAMMIKDGKTAKEIASVLYISESTVKGHFRHIRTKLNITNKKVNLRTYLQSLFRKK